MIPKRSILFGKTVLLAFVCFLPDAQASEQLSIKAGEVRHFQITLASDSAATRLEIPGHAAVEIRPDREGVELDVRKFSWVKGEWVGGKPNFLVFWAKSENTRLLDRLSGIPPRTLHDQTLRGLIRAGSADVQIWLEGQLILNEPLPSAQNTVLALLPGKSTEIKFLEKIGENPHSLFLPVDLGHLAVGDSSLTEREGVPFLANETSPLSLREAGWPEWQDDPWFFYEYYDAGPMFIGDLRIPLIQVPKADYVAAHILATSDEDPSTTNRLTLRAGRRVGGSTNRSQVLFQDFVGEIPRGNELRTVRIPFSKAFAQDVEGDVMDIELTKSMRLARRAPDPNRFRWRPLGRPSGVRIAAITLEKSPIQFVMQPKSSGSLFELPEVPAYSVHLKNITDTAQSFTLEVASEETVFPAICGTLDAGATVEKDISLPKFPVGRHELFVTLKNSAGETLLTRTVAFGVLPKDERRYRAESPFGIWDFHGIHFTPEDDELLGDIYRKLGLRYGLFEATPELRARHGLIRGNDFSFHERTPVENQMAKYHDTVKRHPDTISNVLIFHEDVISGAHATRVPDLFVDRPHYRLNAEEKEKFQKMWAMAEEIGRTFRARSPQVKLYLGNGPITLREEFYRNKFPSELFDAAGNEAGSFGRPPESQPPDSVANNASLWMDRQLLDAYGYAEKPVAQSYEVIYPGTNPGNLSLETHADYFVRHLLHSLVWKIPFIRGGCIADVGNSYRFSNWGSSGLFTARPRLEPKPAALALATLSRVLDGAIFEDFFDLGSESAYLLRFRRKDGSHILVSWVVRGRRDIHLTFSKTPMELRMISRDGKTSSLDAKGDIFTFTASSSPVYVELPSGVNLQKATLGKIVHSAVPHGKVTELSTLDTLEGWEVVQEKNRELEYYNPMSPRRKGNFLFEPIGEFEGEHGALRVTPRPVAGGKPTMPFYAELRRTDRMALPGKPTEIGLWVHGNSGWGRIIFELEDASGQRWTSIGAAAKDGSQAMYGLGEDGQAVSEPVADWNTDDSFGFSRINFDGWRYVGFPLPGQYPGEGFHWPANSLWKSTGDGVVHYPLTLHKVIVELPEKTLYLNRFESAKRPAIALRKLVSVERDMDSPKSDSAEYVEKAQIDMR